MRTESNLLSTTVEQLTEAIVTSGRISRSDQQRFMSALLSQNSLGKIERIHINRVFDLIRAGRIRVVD